MNFQVILLPRAELQLHESALWWSEHRDADQALQWLEGFEQAIRSLSENPLRYGLAEENEAFSIEIRQINYGLSGKPTHRALFEVRDNSKVLVYSIRHLAQDEVSADDLK